MNFVIRWIATAVACAVAVFLIPGMYPVGAQPYMAIILFALILSLLNMTVKPILQFFGAPITFLTLGFFYLVINAVVIGFSSSLSLGLFGAGIYVSSAFSAFFGAIVISIVSGLVNGLLSDK